MNPQILLALATLAVALPAIVDEIIKAKIANALSVALLTSLVGVLFGGAGGLLTQVAHGSTWSDADTVFLAGTISGVAAALANYASMIGKARALSAASKAAGLLAFVGFAAIALPNVGCKAFAASKLPSDLQSEEECAVAQIEAGDTSVSGIATACFSNEISLAEDAILLLLGSPSFTASHASAVVPLRANVAASKAARAGASK